MNGHTATSTSTLGFLTVVDGLDDGLFGGYLILNLMGRPLEFHCTAPIRPNRAQEILYGPTLRPYLYGERIGQALLEKAKASPMVLCTDQRAALAVRPFVDSPVVLVLPHEEESEPGPSVLASHPHATAGPGEAATVFRRLDAPHGPGEPLGEFRLGRNRLALPAVATADRQAIAERLAEVAESFDLAEPFDRIREAIEEARSGGPST